MTDEGLVEKRHIASRHKGPGVGRIKKAAIDPPQRPSTGHEIRNGSQVEVQVVQRGVGHQKDVVEELPEKIGGALDDALAIDLNKSLVSAHPDILRSALSTALARLTALSRMLVPEREAFVMISVKSNSAGI